LARAITTFGEGLAGDAGSPEFRVSVEGKLRELPPLVRDEVHRIAREALRNAFRHAGARRIEVAIHYANGEFRLKVKDDGKGIDPKVLDAGGRTGHHGMLGMRERAELAGGKLTVRSAVGSGAEIELKIPAALAYVKASPAVQTQAWNHNIGERTAQGHSAGATQEHTTTGRREQRRGESSSPKSPAHAA
jgi:signal transduction histidine kinase